jgi:hypothetical protein
MPSDLIAAARGALTGPTHSSLLHLTYPASSVFPFSQRSFYSVHTSLIFSRIPFLSLPLPLYSSISYLPSFTQPFSSTSFYPYFILCNLPATNQ